MGYYDELEAKRRKKEVGMAPHGTDAYYRKAHYVLSAYTDPNKETRDKLKWLKPMGMTSNLGASQ